MERTDFELWKAKEVARLLALVEAERRYYQEMMAAVPVGVAVLSPAGDILWANRSFRRTFNLRIEDLPKKTFEQILPSPLLGEKIAEVLATGASQLNLFVDLPSEQETRLFRVAVLRARNGEDDAEGEALVVVEDITGIERLRAVPEAAAATAEAPAAPSGPSAADLDEKQREDQWVQSQRAEALSGLAARLAHDLNNPLMIITGYAEEILNGLGPQDPLRPDMREILSAAERIAALTGQLLTFTRRQARPPQPVELGRTITEIDARIHQAAGEAAVEILPTETTDWVAADKGQLEEVILALVSGAREDARERTKVTLWHGPQTIQEDRRVSGSTLAPGSYVKLVIQDDGRGLAPSQKAAIFEHFLTAKDPEKSIGPALARAYRMVREWGGDIAVSSEPQRGMAFSVYLPAAVPAAAAPPTVEAQPVAEPQSAPDAILVVEDEPGIRLLMRKILIRQGYHVLEAASGPEALKLATGYPGKIVLLVTDMVMPEMSGKDLAAQLAEMTRDLRILYISGYTPDAAISSAELPPGSDFLQKPFTLGSLVNKVRALLV